MALSYNDLQTKARTISIDIDQDALVTGAVRIFAISVAATTDIATVFINDALTKAGGGTTVTVKGAVGHATLGSQTITKYFGPTGIRFSTGLSIDSTGTGVTGSVQYIVE